MCAQRNSGVHTRSWLCKWETSIIARTKSHKQPQPINSVSGGVVSFDWLKYQEPFAEPKRNCRLGFKMCRFVLCLWFITFEGSCYVCRCNSAVPQETRKLLTPKLSFTTNCPLKTPDQLPSPLQGVNHSKSNPRPYPFEPWLIFLAARRGNITPWEEKSLSFFSITL